MAATLLQAARIRAGYKQEQVISDLLKLAKARNVPAMSPLSLKTKLSRWENGHEQVSAPYQALFRELYGRTNEELGFPPEEVDESAEHLRERIAIARTVDAGTVELFRQQLEQARALDRQFGGVTTLDQLRAQIAKLQELLDFSITNGQREPLARVLTEVSALAGWEAIDRNAHAQAWQHHETAKAAAREAGDRHLLAHAMAQQAFILVDLGETAMAVEQLAAARQAAVDTSPLLRAWLAAAHGEGLAAGGRRDDALRAFDDAATLLPSDPVEPHLSFLFLAGSHLDRWRGNVLSQLGEPDAIDQLARTLPLLPPDFNRARASMLVDLAYAHAAAGDRDGALDYARQARRLASQIKSDRQLQRLGRLVLPV
ncbi:hypothetical protein BAY59_27750 [Prauserella coralliicola]|nr:hypothetical protein BAY59_27750 [Prauserella coralliicola]